MANYIILLPPSESKKKEGDENKPYRLAKNLKKNNYFISLESDREYVYGKLREAITVLKEKELEKVLELKGKKLQESIETISDMLNLPVMEAIERYTGVMFSAINYEKMTSEQKENFNNSVLFIDGMFGLLKPTDLIPDYKLKINSKYLEIDISKFWKERLKGILEVYLKDKIVIDILPESHRKILNPNLTNIIQISFCELKNGKLVQVGHDSKKLKGEIINMIVSKENINTSDLKGFKHSMGYSFSEKNSTEKLFVYLKN